MRPNDAQISQDKKVVVKAINRLRKQAGLGRITKLRRGIPLHVRANPVAMSLDGTGITECHASWYATPKAAYLWDHWLDVEEREALARLMGAIDAGHCPDLEMPKTPIKIKFPGQRKATIINDDQ